MALFGAHESGKEFVDIRPLIYTFEKFIDAFEDTLAGSEVGPQINNCYNIL